MKPLAELIADALIWCGAVSVITSEAAAMPACAPVVTVPKHDRRDLEQSMLTTNPIAYDGDTEFIEAALPKISRTRLIIWACHTRYRQPYTKRR